LQKPCQSEKPQNLDIWGERLFIDETVHCFTRFIFSLKAGEARILLYLKKNAPRENYAEGIFINKQ